MITVTGIFTARHDAERAAETLARLGIPRDRISVLAPGPAGGETGWVGTTEAEAPGVGRVIGGGVGDALDTTLSEGLPKDEVFLYEDVAAELEARYPTAYASPAFRRGFERGRRWDDAAREGRCAA